MVRRLRAVLCLLTSCLLGATNAAAQDHEKLNEANNPLTPKITVNLQDYYVPSTYGLAGRDANQFLLRGLLPWKAGTVPSLLRFTMPFPTAPTLPSGTDSGAGDLTLMNLFMFPGRVSYAAGPILVAPTASADPLGSGRWQAGAAGVAIAPQSWGLLGGLVTYQHSFGEDHGRLPVSLLTFQPIVNYNLPNQFYLRSSATWTFDLEKDGSYIPIGLGIGRVWLLAGDITMNTFVEPQFTVWHDGDGAPQWQIFGGVNFQFPVGK